MSCRLSYVIVSWNRRERLLETLSLLPEHQRLRSDEWEIIVVDNASSDGTAAAVRRHFPGVRVVERPTNEGMSGRNHGFAIARGKYIVITDDDSYPVGDTSERAMGYLDGAPRVASVSGRIVLPDGSLEAAALPAILLGGATYLRRSLMAQLGGFSQDFFRQAEEWDLSFRIWNLGYRVERFEDLLFRHERYPAGRSSGLRARLDMRNNLLLAHRYLPQRIRNLYGADWVLRYAALARHQRLQSRALLGRVQGKACGLREALRPQRKLSPRAFESIFQWQAQERQVREWACDAKVQRVAIAGLSKNVYATYRACRVAGLEVVCLLDDNPAYQGLSYRGLPVCPLSHGQRPDAVEAIVVSNTNPAQAEGLQRDVAAVFSGPVLGLWRPALLGTLVSDQPGVEEAGLHPLALGAASRALSVNANSSDSAALHWSSEASESPPDCRRPI